MTMNRNEMIGTAIGKTLGYAVQGVMYSKIAQITNPQTVIVVKIATKYGKKVVQYAAKKHVRTDFSNETVFSDAIDSSFFAD